MRLDSAWSADLRMREIYLDLAVERSSSPLPQIRKVGTGPTSHKNTPAFATAFVIPLNKEPKYYGYWDS
jgi:hypothetical protein